MTTKAFSPASPVFSSNYAYDSEGTLRDLEKGNQFQFKDQKAYDSLADDVLEYCASLLDTKLKRREDYPLLSGCPVWVSSSASSQSNLADAEKLLVLIQGSGRVRAGVWGCALCINAENGLHKGTMLQYIDRILKENEAKPGTWGIVVMNPNENSAKYHPGSENPITHLVNSWRDIVEEEFLGKDPKKKEIYVVAHSNGGRCFLGLMQNLVERTPAVRTSSASFIHKIAMTDTYHGVEQMINLYKTASDQDREFFNALFGKRTRNYVPSEVNVPVGTPTKVWVSLKNQCTAETRFPIPCLACGVNDHASTNYASMEAIFEWFLGHEG